MPQSDHQLLIQSKPYFYSIVLSGGLCLASLFAGSILLALLSFILGLLLMLGKLKGAELQEPEKARTQFRWITLGLAATSLLGVYFGESTMKVWLYALPLLIFFFYEFKPAFSIIALLSLVTIVVLNGLNSPFENIQFIGSYILYIGISCSLVYLREIRRKQLKPLRRTDNLTKAATQEHLDEDLAKEVQRSEREGSDLAVMAMALDPSCISKLSQKQQAEVNIDIGKLLHNNLRVFDSYYLWDQDEFLIVLPHTNSAQSIKIANELRIKVRKEISAAEESVTISVGIAGLNVGDDSKALVKRAADALAQTVAKGSNRTQLYREDKAGDKNGGEA